MYRFLLKPKWLAFHLLCLAVMVAMILLGLWQVRRLHERTSFNDRVKSHNDAPVVPLADVLKLSPADVEYRQVELSGTYDLQHEFLVPNVTQYGNVGRDVIGSLRLSDGSIVIINRGFVTNHRAVPAPPEGPVLVVGRVKLSQTPGIGEPADDGSQVLTELRRIDLSALSKQFTTPVAPVYIELVTSNPPEPKGLSVIQFPSLDNGPHLSYAIQWLIFTICVAVGWVFAVRKSARTYAGLPPKRRKGPPPIADEFL